MKTIFHDKESGTKLEMEGTFANSKAQLLDNEGNVVIESEGSYSEILEMINQLSEGENRQETEEPKQYEEPLTNSDFRGTKVKVLEDIEDEYRDILEKGTITTDVTVSVGENLFIKGVFVEPEDFNKLEILADEEQNIQEGELFVVNNDEMEYYLGFDKGEIVKFLFHKEGDLPLMFVNSKDVEQALSFEDVTVLENQEGNSRKFDFCAKNDILFTEDTNLKETKVSLTEDSDWIEDDGFLTIHTDCADGVPYIVSNNSGDGAFVGLSKLKLRTEEDTLNLKVGDYVKVKEGKECSGAKGFAIVTDIEEDRVRLKGIDEYGIYNTRWANNTNNLIKIG
ncbi:four helix bundle protein [Staphylococcus phage VB-SauS-SA2]|nr:four helix bundle protein [Staphylococcus phage VB-SauS-SA2]